MANHCLSFVTGKRNGPAFPLIDTPARLHSDAIAEPLPPERERATLVWGVREEICESDWKSGRTRELSTLRAGEKVSATQRGKASKCPNPFSGFRLAKPLGLTVSGEHLLLRRDQNGNCGGAFRFRICWARKLEKTLKQSGSELFRLMNVA